MSKPIKLLSNQRKQLFITHSLQEKIMKDRVEAHAFLNNIFITTRNGNLVNIKGLIKNKEGTIFKFIVTPLDIKLTEQGFVQNLNLSTKEALNCYARKDKDSFWLQYKKTVFRLDDSKRDDFISMINKYPFKKFTSK